MWYGLTAMGSLLILVLMTFSVCRTESDHDHDDHDDHEDEHVHESEYTFTVHGKLCSDGFCNPDTNTEVRACTCVVATVSDIKSKNQCSSITNNNVSCVCGPGYEIYPETIKTGDVVCKDHDECEDNECEDACENTVGATDPICLCTDEGKRLGENGKSCIDASFWYKWQLYIIIGSVAAVLMILGYSACCCLVKNKQQVKKIDSKQQYITANEMAMELCAREGLDQPMREPERITNEQPIYDYDPQGYPDSQGYSGQQPYQENMQRYGSMQPQDQYGQYNQGAMMQQGGVRPSGMDMQGQMGMGGMGGMVGMGVGGMGMGGMGMGGMVGMQQSPSIMGGMLGMGGMQQRSPSMMGGMQGMGGIPQSHPSMIGGMQGMGGTPQSRPSMMGGMQGMGGTPQSRPSMMGGMQGSMQGMGGRGMGGYQAW